MDEVIKISRTKYKTIHMLREIWNNFFYPKKMNNNYSHLKASYFINKTGCYWVFVDVRSKQNMYIQWKYVIKKEEIKLPFLFFVCRTRDFKSTSVIAGSLSNSAIARKTCWSSLFLFFTPVCRCWRLFSKESIFEYML